MLQYCIKHIQANINKYILHVLSIKLRYKLQFSFSISTPGFPRFYYMSGANLGLLLYGEVSVMVNINVYATVWGARWLSGKVSDSGARKYWLITQEAMAQSRHD